VDKQHIINEIKRTAAANGGAPLGRSRFERETGIAISHWSGKLWARWSDALREAGFEPNQLQTAYDEDKLIETFIKFMRELGHFPVAAEVKLKARSDKAFPWHNTFGRFGSKAQFAKRIVQYCEDHARHDDIIVLCKPIAASANDISAVGSIEPVDDGFVYLAKSGRYYKIGRTNSVGRREYELAIQ
jgi:hypothetical protein